tara:strand:+ start:296 stop:454 length:159 start_codon:yes stop_codon:yes gene_type:complete
VVVEVVKMTTTLEVTEDLVVEVVLDQDHLLYKVDQETLLLLVLLKEMMVVTV